jgi:hypothetical protein
MPNSIANCWSPTSRPRISGGAHSATYLHQISRGFPLEGCSVQWNGHRERTDGEPDNEATSEDSLWPRRRHSDALDDNAENEDAGEHDDRILAAEDLSEKAGAEHAEPGAELKDGRQPALFGLVCHLSAFSMIDFQQ